MRVLVLGGGGVMGGGGVQALQSFPGIESVVIADMDKRAADALAKDLDFPKVSTVQLDVTDTKKVTELAREADVVFNAVGPFVKFGVPTLKAIIEGGADYVDVCDDADATEALLELDAMAKKAGVTALLSMGQTPGIANMQAKYLAQMLDEVDSIKIAWACGAPDVGLLSPEERQSWNDSYGMADESGETFKKASPAGWNHLVHSCSGNIPIWKNGKFDTIAAWDSGEYIDFAEPLGRFPVFYVGHSEPITLPRYIKVKDFCACLGGNMMHKALRKEARGHEEPAHPPVKPDTPLWPTPDRWKNLGVYQGQAVIAEGWKDGKRVRYTNRYMCSIFDRGAYTFAGQAIGIYLLGKMKDKPKGVFGPEGLLDTEDFFNELVRVTNQVNGWNFTLEELLPTQREEIG